MVPWIGVTDKTYPEICALFLTLIYAGTSILDIILQTELKNKH